MKTLKTLKIDRDNKITIILLGILIALSALTSTVIGAEMNTKSDDPVVVANKELDMLLSDILDDLKMEDDNLFGYKQVIRIYDLNDSLIVNSNEVNLSHDDRTILRRSDFLFFMDGADYYLFTTE